MDDEEFPKNLTPSEVLVAHMSLEVAFHRAKRNFTLDEIIEMYDAMHEKPHTTNRNTVNRFLYFIELKTAGSKHWRLKRTQKVGRGQKAHFHWEQVT